VGRRLVEELPPLHERRLQRRERLLDERHEYGDRMVLFTPTARLR
jgi:hypothetical protein